MTFVSSFLGICLVSSCPVQPYPLNGVLETHTPKSSLPRPRGEVPEERGLPGCYHKLVAARWLRFVPFVPLPLLSNSISIAFIS